MEKIFDRITGYAGYKNSLINPVILSRNSCNVVVSGLDMMYIVYVLMSRPDAILYHKQQSPIIPGSRRNKKYPVAS